MATRSIIGTTTGKTFEGIYCHFDGYPSGMIPNLAKIITRDGEAAIPALTGQAEVAPAGAPGSWESITPEMPAHDTPLPYPDQREYWENVPAGERDRGISSLYAHLYRGDRAEDRERIAEGYGVIHRATEGIRFTGVLDGSVDTGMCEWAYLFTDDLTLVVYELFEDFMMMRERFSREDLAVIAADREAMRDRIERAECGWDYERCSHMAWVHESELPKESLQLSMREWLGFVPMYPNSAVAAVVDGKRYELSTATAVRKGVYERRVKGSEKMLPVAKVLGDGEYSTLPGVQLVFPPTKYKQGRESSSTRQ